MLNLDIKQPKKNTPGWLAILSLTLLLSTFLLIGLGPHDLIFPFLGFLILFFGYRITIYVLSVEEGWDKLWEEEGETTPESYTNYPETENNLKGGTDTLTWVTILWFFYFVLYIFIAGNLR